jgi:predicted RNase H-like nuclease (RuvC/YqgF family)
MSDTEKKWFWVGKGTPRPNGVPVHHGEEINPDDVRVAVKVKDKDPKAEADLKYNLKEANAENKKLKKEINDLKAMLEKAKSGKKADELKKLAEANKVLEGDVGEAKGRIKELEADIEAKDKEIEALTAPDTGAAAGPGGA